jgi:hypothetical protein
MFRVWDLGFNRGCSHVFVTDLRSGYATRFLNYCNTVSKLLTYLSQGSALGICNTVSKLLTYLSQGSALGIFNMVSRPA